MELLVAVFLRSVRNLIRQSAEVDGALTGNREVGTFVPLMVMYNAREGGVVIMVVKLVLANYNLSRILPL